MSDMTTWIKKKIVLNKLKFLLNLEHILILITYADKHGDCICIAQTNYIIKAIFLLFRKVYKHFISSFKLSNY